MPPPVPPLVVLEPLVAEAAPPVAAPVPPPMVPPVVPPVPPVLQPVPLVPLVPEVPVPEVPEVPVVPVVPLRPVASMVPVEPLVPMVPVAPEVPEVPVPIEPLVVPLVPIELVPVLPDEPLVPIELPEPEEPLVPIEPLVPDEPLVELRVSGSLERPVLVRPASTPELLEPLWLSFMLPELLVPIAPLLPDEPLWSLIELPVWPALLLPLLLSWAPFLLRLCFEVSVVAAADEVPLLWSLMLLLPLVPAPRVFWVPSDDCAWTVVAPNMAAATEAPSRPFSSLFSFMVDLLNLSSGLKCSTISIRY